jgi:long-subunit acyl-CoA synthetase (AMP-forming)
VCGLLWGLAYGAAVALGRGSKYLLADCEHFRPTILPAVPSIINVLVQRACLNRELSTVLIGAAPLTTETMLALGSSGRKIYIGYGLTETSSGLAITQKLSEPNELYPCPDVDICIEADGEISVTTPCMMEGYLTFAAKESFTPARGERFYTGDLGFLTRDSALVLTGRKKDLLILPDGTKIFCPDYENALAPMIGTDDIALVLRDHKPVLIVGGMSSDYYQQIVNIVEDFNSMQPHSARVYDVILQEAPLPRTQAGKLRRWQVDPEQPLPSDNE